MLEPGMPFIRMGSGPRLLFLPGLSPDHAVPNGMDLAFQTRQLRPFAERHEVWWVNRRRGLPPGTTIAELAEDYARVVREHLEPPVDVVAVSTGATIGLRLALEHPELVRRLVVAGAARLSEPGRGAQRAVLDRLRDGRPRRAAARMFRTMAGGPLSGAALLLLGWLVGKRMYGGDVADMLVTAEAELDEDVQGELRGIRAPTLVIGGARDRFYSPALLRSTAAGLDHGSLLLFGRMGHLRSMSSPHFPRAVLAFLEDRSLGSLVGGRRVSGRRSGLHQQADPAVPGAR